MPEPAESSASAEFRRVMHDLNNIIAVFQGHLDAAVRALPEEASPVRRHMDAVTDTLRRAEDAVRKLSVLVAGQDPALLFPRASGDAPRALAGGETILIVDDEPAIRGLAARFLDMNGYKVLEASGPAEALAKAEGAALDALVTDVNMPGGSGVDLARDLRARRPGLKVLYLSGSVSDDSRRALAGEGGGEFLMKPVRPKDLLLRLRGILDASASGR